ncbi:major histocompatibility complex class I-related gene protein-like [Symphorus nematophorus]
MTLMSLALVGILLHVATAVTHSLTYFYTASSGVPNFPEFVVVGLVDEVQMIHYDSNTERAESRQEWMSRATANYDDYWGRETKACKRHQRHHKASIEGLKRHFNQSGDVHIVQWMYGCEWDDETDEVHGYDQYGYDGEDFISFDLKTETWIAPKQQAFNTKNKWDHDSAWMPQTKSYLTRHCPDWLKKYVEYGRSSLLRTELPSVSLLQKTSSSPVRCHASGFYPDRASLFWRKDGEELHEGVDHGEILPNHDGTFQMSVDLDVSSVTPADWSKYECVFQLSGVKEDVTKLNKAVIITNEGSPVHIYVIVAVVVFALALIAAIGFMVYKKKKAAKCPPSPDSGSELSEKLNPQPI